jgi:hypothetical protein
MMIPLKARPIPATAALWLTMPLSVEDTQVDYIPDEVDTVKHDEFAPGADTPLPYVQAVSPVLSFKVDDDGA